MAENNKEEGKARALNQSEQISEETKARTSNGNREVSDSEKEGGAQRGGPGTTHAEKAQPPDAEKPY
jgi:hypothetical protein